MHDSYHLRNAAKAEWRAGWPVLAASTIGYGTGSGMFFMTASLFVEPMRQALGWSTLALTISPVTALVVALGQPLAGRLTQRWGGRAVAISGAALLTIAFLATAFIPTNRWLYLGMGLIIGLIGPLTTTVPYSRCIATFFSRNLGLALGIALSGSSLVSFVTIPLVSYMMAECGWRVGYLTLAAASGLVGLPLLLLALREHPVPVPDVPPLAPTNRTGALLHNRIFWFLLIALLLAALPLGGFVMHIVPMLLDRGVGKTLATSLPCLPASAGSAAARCWIASTMERWLLCFWHCLQRARWLSASSTPGYPWQFFSLPFCWSAWAREQRPISLASSASASSDMISIRLS